MRHHRSSPGDDNEIVANQGLACPVPICLCFDPNVCHSPPGPCAGGLDMHQITPSWIRGRRPDSDPDLEVHFYDIGCDHA